MKGKYEYAFPKYDWPKGTGCKIQTWVTVSIFVVGGCCLDCMHSDVTSQRFGLSVGFKKPRPILLSQKGSEYGQTSDVQIFTCSNEYGCIDVEYVHEKLRKHYFSKNCSCLA